MHACVTEAVQGQSQMKLISIRPFQISRADGKRTAFKRLRCISHLPDQQEYLFSRDATRESALWLQSYWGWTAVTSACRWPDNISEFEHNNQTRMMPLRRTEPHQLYQSHFIGSDVTNSSVIMYFFLSVSAFRDDDRGSHMSCKNILEADFKAFFILSTLCTGSYWCLPLLDT